MLLLIIYSRDIDKKCGERDIEDMQQRLDLNQGYVYMVCVLGCLRHSWWPIARKLMDKNFDIQLII